LDTRGFILFQQGKYAEAKVAFEKAFVQESKDKLVLEHLGDVSIKLGDKSKAVEFWQKAKALGSTNQLLDKKIDKKEYYDPIY
jgi:predicted negative regulator of RcsB-dependent stress response